MNFVDTIVDPNNGLSVTERPKALADRLRELWTMISEVSDNLPPETLRWRIQNWLLAGQGRVERGLEDMKVRCRHMYYYRLTTSHATLAAGICCTNI